MPRRPGTGSFASRTPAQEQIFILSRAVQQSPNAILIARADGVIEYLNPSFTQLTGYTPEELLGEHPLFSLGEEGVLSYYRGLKATLREGRSWRGEIRGKRKSGEVYWAFETITPIQAPDGKISHFLVIRQDITQQKINQQALEESEARFRQVAEMTGEWLWEQDAQGCYTYSSAAVKDILGYRPKEIIGKSYVELLADEALTEGMAGFSGLIALGRGFCRLLNCYRHKDGHTIYTESTGEPLFDRKGRVVKWRGVDNNITARKRYEDELRLRNRAIEAASVGISIIDAVSGLPIIYANPTLCRITGYSREELMGHDLRMLQGPDTDPAAVAKVVRALTQARECEVTLKNYRKDGSAFWNNLLISPVKDERGRLTHFIGIQADVTAKKKAEDQQHELDIARQIQLSLLPKAPLSLPNVQVFGVCLPASHVGGDYFDYFRVGEYLDIVIADVAGHSVGSALIMAEARSSLKAAARRTKNEAEHGPGETLRALNELLHEDLDRADSFISLFYLRYDPRTRHLRYASAGHNPPLLLRAGAPACEPLDADGMVVGVMREVEFEEVGLDLTPGDRLLLYTDGIVEARGADGDFFGTHRLCRLFASLRELPPRQVVERIQAELSAFGGESACEDDVTLIVAQID